MILFSTLLGLSWNLLGGYAGQISFGHSAFLGVGAYTTLLLYLKLSLSPFIGIFIGGIFAVIIAIPIGILCFRLRGPYFSLSTLAVAEILRLLALNLDKLTSGPQGLLITNLPSVEMLGIIINWEKKLPFFYIISLIVLFGMFLTYFVSKSRLGAYLIAIKEDIDSAEAVGINTVYTRVVALGLSAFLVGLAGGFYGIYFRYIDPDAVFSIAMSVEMVFVAVVGGIATTGGPIVGAIALVIISEIFRTKFQVGHLIFYGLFMMIVIRYMPEGIWGRLRTFYKSKNDSKKI
jgi:branched-chain amino acid transport system permease protein